MTIEQLGKTRFLIALCSQDMKDFSLNFDTMSLWDDHSRKVLSRLLHLASNKTGISIKENSVLVEAVPYDLGCVLLVSLIDKVSKRKVYKVKKSRGIPCVLFDTVTELLRCAEVFYRQEISLHTNSLWLFDGKYFLLLEYPFLSDRAKAILGEFGKVYLLSRTAIAAVKERGKVICKDDAISTIGQRISG